MFTGLSAHSAVGSRGIFARADALIAGPMTSRGEAAL